ncbi:MAG TPA: hypothetical protein VGI51_01315, partial [Steroidobacteraceae bacterium]
MIGMTHSRMALLLATALGTAATVGAADASGKPSLELQQIQLLQQQLGAVQAQMKQLAEQNQMLMQKELELERQVAQQNLAARAPAASPTTTASVANAAPASPAASASNAAPASPAVPTSSGVPTPAATAMNGASAAGAGPGAVPAAPNAPPGAAFSNVRLWGYGELYYTRPTRDPSRAQADLARAVFGIGYSFDSRTEFNSEFEVEHAVASSSDPGEFEVEQFYVDRQLADEVTLR